MVDRIVHELVLGTHNVKKGAELLRLLGPFGFRISTLREYPHAVEVVEDGQSFAENARLKAQQQAVHLGRWVLGEDSGLVVDALDGAPGIYSARYAGEGATDQKNNQRLLKELESVEPLRRTARYVCHIALADPSGAVRAESEAYCRGRIALQPRGTSGFGYDPLFEIPEYHATLAELGDTVKAMLSHRSRAVQLLIPQLVQLRDAMDP